MPELLSVETQVMKKILLFLSAVALFLTIIPPILTAMGRLDAGLMKDLLLGATLLWFAVWPVAIRSKAP